LPSDRVLHLNVDEVLAIHERLLETFGGPRGVRDLGLLESALFRPRTGYYRDIAEMAAALFESLLMNHPFIDGNKEAHAFLIALLEKGQCDFEHLLPWIRSALVRL
jgi:death-on-curing protein